MVSYRRYDAPEPTPLALLLQRAWEAGRAAWPTVAVPTQRFAAYLMDCCARMEGDPAEALAQLQHADLYLACALPDAAALAILDREFLKPMEAELSALPSGRDRAQEIIQVLRERILCPRVDAPGRIIDYAGRGALRGWLRVVAKRTARNLQRGLAAQPGLHQSEGALAKICGEDPELRYLRQRYDSVFRAALTAAFAALPAGARDLLRASLRERKTTIELARLQGTHHTTIVRRLAHAREALRKGVRLSLQEQLTLDAAEVESLLRLLPDALDLSISHLLDG